MALAREQLIAVSLATIARPNVRGGCHCPLTLRWNRGKGIYLVVVIRSNIASDCHASVPTRLADTSRTTFRNAYSGNVDLARWQELTLGAVCDRRARRLFGMGRGPARLTRFSGETSLLRERRLLAIHVQRAEGSISRAVGASSVPLGNVGASTEHNALCYASKGCRDLI